MVKLLIINADDFGMCESVDEGIIHGYKAGLITSTTVFMNQPHIAEDLKRLEHLDIGVGVHLNVTFGTPLTNGQSFLKEGRFRKRGEYIGGILIDENDLYNEWKAQIERFISLTHKKPDHIDSHHNIHLLYPDVYHKLADEYDLPTRNDRNRKIHLFHLKDAICDRDVVKEAIKKESGTLEIMTHPGYYSIKLAKISSYACGRERELSFWCDPKTKQALKDVQLGSFRDLEK
jgi:predicted glycoside hydrolase/deacetylase ChbG (UPF0249 family)